MQRRKVCSLAAALVFGSASAFAQDGDLSNVTMRVLDDLSGVDTVLLELDSNRGKGEEGAESDSRDAATSDGSGRDAAPAEADDDELRDRDELHEDDDDRNERRREDRDVERPAVPPPTP